MKVDEIERCVCLSSALLLVSIFPSFLDYMLVCVLEKSYIHFSEVRLGVKTVAVN